MARRLSMPNALGWLGVGSLLAPVLNSLVGLPPQGHDTLLHFYRIPAINALWQRGVLYSRWLPDVFFGYGSPLFNFYPPLSAYVLAITYWAVGANAPVAMNVAFGLTLIVAAAGMFALGRQLFGNLGGLFAAAAYTLSPHLLYQTFARASISDAMAMSLMPVALLTILLVSQRPTRGRACAAALACAGVLLSHMATSVLFAAPLILLGAAGAWTATPARRRTSLLLAVCAALALGIALAAFSWLPAVAELGDTRYDMVTGPDKIDFREHFADTLQWPGRAIDGLVNAPLPKTVGPVQFALAALGIVVALRQLLKGTVLERGPLDRQAMLTALIGLVGMGAVFMASSSSTWFWENLSLLRSLQFPWRWLEVGAFFVALACGYLAQQVGGRQWWHAALLGIGLSAFFVSAVPYLYPPRIRWLPRQPTLVDVTWAQERYGIYGLTSWGEYTTRAVPASAWPLEPPFPGADLGASLDAKLQRSKLPVDALISADGDSWHAALHLVLPAEDVLTFDSHYFPGWAAQIDGRRSPVRPDEEGRLSVVVPAGEHTVSVGFGRTPVRWVADIASVIAALAVVLVIVWPRLRSNVVPSEASIRPTVADKSEGTQAATYALVGVLAALALCKFLLLDHTNSLLVVHPQDDRIPGVSVPPYGDFGMIRLIGYDIQSPDQLTLYWKAEQAPTTNCAIVVTVVDSSGAEVDKLVNPFPGHNCTSNWAEEQLTRDEYALPADASWPAGTYKLQVAVRDSATQQALPLVNAPGGEQLQAPVGNVELASR